MAASSVRAKSFTRRIEPSGSVRRMMFSNSSTVSSRLFTSTAYWNSTPAFAGGCPTDPAGRSTFCSLIALATSPAVSPNFVSLSGRSHTRIE